MSQSASTVPSFALRGVATGVFFMAFFGTLWASIGVGGLLGLGGIWPTIVVLLIGIVLFGGGITLIKGSRRLPNQVGETGGQQQKRVGLWFNLVFAAEGILIFIASVVCNMINRFDLFFPIMAIIVGLHFFPLAPLFNMRPYYLVGALLCLFGLLTLFVIPQNAIIAGHQIDAHWTFLGLSAAIVLWGVGIMLWLLGRKLLASATPIEVQKTA